MRMRVGSNLHTSSFECFLFLRSFGLGLFVPTSAVISHHHRRRRGCRCPHALAKSLKLCKGLPARCSIAGPARMRPPPPCHTAHSSLVAIPCPSACTCLCTCPSACPCMRMCPSPCPCLSVHVSKPVPVSVHVSKPMPVSVHVCKPMPVSFHVSKPMPVSVCATVRGAVGWGTALLRDACCDALSTLPCAANNSQCCTWPRTASPLT